eukprot:SAG31_NODE_6948_length_1840_cov_1.426766_2_plen_105_part_00
MLIELAEADGAVMDLIGQNVIDSWHAFVHTNAEVIWNRAACVTDSPLAVGQQAAALPVFGTSWIGPCNTIPGGVTAVAQTSALDVLVADMELSCRHERSHGTTK